MSGMAVRGARAGGSTSQRIKGPGWFGRMPAM